MLAFIGTLFVTGTSLGFFLICTNYVFKDGYNLDLYWPLIIIGVMVFFIAGHFLGVVDETLIATVQSYCVDCDLNDHVPKWGPVIF